MPLDPGHLSRRGLRLLGVAAIKAANTIAQDRVYDPDTLPQQVSELPTIVVSTPSARKENAGEGNAKFNTVILLTIMARVTGTVSKQAFVERNLDLIVEQIEEAILCAPTILGSRGPVRRFQHVEAHSVLDNTTDELVGEAAVVIACEVPQDYLPAAGEPLTEIDVATREPAHPGPGFKSFLHP